MMDLVEEYFKRDLSAAEEAQLAKLLAGSPEAAQKMAEGMAGPLPPGRAGGARLAREAPCPPAVGNAPGPGSNWRF